MDTPASTAPGAAGPLRLAVLASGGGSNLQALIDAIAADRLHARIVGVFSDRADAGALARARQAGLPAHALRPRDWPDRAAHDTALFDAIAAVQPDLIVCAGYMRIIGAHAIARFAGRMLNIHPSLLPRHPGLHTHARAIAAGDAEHGASVHVVTPDLDAGPVLAQARVPVRPDDTPETLAARVLAREHPLLVATIAALADRRLHIGPDGKPRLDGVPLCAPLQLDARDRLHAH